MNIRVIRFYKFIEILLNSSKSSIPLFVNIFTLRFSQFLSLEIDIRIKISKLVHEFLFDIREHEPYKNINGIFNHSQMSHKGSGSFLKSYNFLLIFKR